MTVEAILESFDRAISKSKIEDTERTWREELFNEDFNRSCAVRSVLASPLEQLVSARDTLHMIGQEAPAMLANLKSIAKSGNPANYPLEWFDTSQIIELRPIVIMDYVTSIKNTFAKFIKMTDKDDIQDAISDLEDPVTVRRLRASLVRTKLPMENSSKFVRVMTPMQTMVTTQVVRQTLIPAVDDFITHDEKDDSDSKENMVTSMVSFDKLLRLTKKYVNKSADAFDSMIEIGIGLETGQRKYLNRRFFEAATRTYLEGCKYLLGALGAYFCMWIGKMKGVRNFTDITTPATLNIKPYTESLANDLDGFDSATFAPLVNAASNLKNSMINIDVAMGSLSQYPKKEYTKIMAGLSEVEKGIDAAVNLAKTEDYIGDDIIKMAKIQDSEVDAYLNLEGFESPRVLRENLHFRPDVAPICELTTFIDMIQLIATGINYLRDKTNHALKEVELNVNHAFDKRTSAEILRVAFTSIQDKLGDFSRDLYDRASSRLEAINQIVTGKALLNFKSIRMDCSPRFHSEIFTAINEEAEDTIAELNTKYSRMYVKKMLMDKTYLEDDQQNNNNQGNNNQPANNNQGNANPPANNNNQQNGNNSNDNNQQQNNNQNNDQQNNQNQDNDQNNNQNGNNQNDKKKGIFQAIKDAINSFFQDMSNRVNGEEGKKNKSFLQRLKENNIFGKKFTNVNIRMPKYLQKNPLQVLVSVSANISSLQENDLRNMQEKDLFVKVFNTTNITYDQYKSPKEGSFQKEIYKSIQVGKSGNLESITIPNSAINQYIKPMYDFLDSYYNGGDLPKLKSAQDQLFKALDVFGSYVFKDDRLNPNLNALKSWTTAVSGAVQQAMKDRKNNNLSALNTLDGGSSNGNNGGNNDQNQGNDQNNQNGQNPQNAQPQQQNGTPQNNGQQPINQQQ